MTAAELKKGMKLWCWWQSRYLWYTGRSFEIESGERVFVFEDVADAQVRVSEADLDELKRRA